MDKQIAVIIPTLNEERFIGGLLDSIISQSYPFNQLDVMVVDGGSVDATKEIVNNYASRYDNIRLIENKKKIQSAAFNIGVKNSDAPFVIRLDAHAKYDIKYIEICYELLRNNPEYGNVGGVCAILPQHSHIQAQANAIVNKVRFGIGGASFRVGAKAGPVDTVPFGAFPRKVITQIGGMREDLARGEDNEYNSRIRKAGFTIFLDPRIKCSYYARPTLASSCQQMYNNGVSIGKLVHIDKKAIGFRHLIPMSFLLSLIVGFLFGIFIPGLYWLFWGILGVYLIAALSASISACSKYGFKFFLILPIFFLTIHMSYGLGTIVGLIKGKSHQLND